MNRRTMKRPATTSPGARRGGARPGSAFTVGSESASTVSSLCRTSFDSSSVRAPVDSLGWVGEVDGGTRPAHRNPPCVKRNPALVAEPEPPDQLVEVDTVDARMLGSDGDSPLVLVEQRLEVGALEDLDCPLSTSR